MGPGRRAVSRASQSAPARERIAQGFTKVEDVAATILFLASPENKVTRGGIVPVYGRS